MYQEQLFQLFPASVYLLQQTRFNDLEALSDEYNAMMMQMSLDANLNNQYLPQDPWQLVLLKSPSAVEHASESRCIELPEVQTTIKNINWRLRTQTKLTKRDNKMHKFEDATQTKMKSCKSKANGESKNVITYWDNIDKTTSKEHVASDIL